MRGLLRGIQLLAQRISLIRYLWITMVVVHMPALEALWRALLTEGVDSVRLGSFVALNLATLFFLVKTLLPRLLTFQSDSRSLAAVTLGVVLLHASAVELRLHDGSYRQELPVAGSLLFAAGFSFVQGSLRTLLARLSVAKRAVRLAGMPLADACDRPRDLLLVACLCAPRAPPASSRLR